MLQNNRRKVDDINLLVLPKSLQGSLKSTRGKKSRLLVARGLSHEKPLNLATLAVAGSVYCTVVSSGVASCSIHHVLCPRKALYGY